MQGADFVRGRAASPLPHFNNDSTAEGLLLSVSCSNGSNNLLPTSTAKDGWPRLFSQDIRNQYPYPASLLSQDSLHVLVHAGDLTENGSFEEAQAGLIWLSSQQQTHKIFVAGNHDVLLDEAFLEEYPERCYGDPRAKRDLNWGSIIYLEESSTTLWCPQQLSDMADLCGQAPLPSTVTGMGTLRKLTVFGSPWTPQYGIPAFQYRPEDVASHWEGKIGLPTPDVLVTHGPPRLHLDSRDFHRAVGCPYLAECVAEIRPRLAVFGHIHVSYGREDVILDGLQRALEKVDVGWGRWGTVIWMATLLLWERVGSRIPVPRRHKDTLTTFVNAAVVGGPRNELVNQPAVIKL
ncbi:hypothetical protein VTK73DRAFT_4264 [Phialemonium thermophilum]|uniref:Calcineurin-like phosphoesterase domain-containing protein n=1 Tax=Phialemonium thermophilum TaxID=223376 RepID=A0ABR3WUX7_9PEZI